MGIVDYSFNRVSPAPFVQKLELKLLCWEHHGIGGGMGREKCNKDAGMKHTELE